ncbi:unnamed protein product [Phaeothamnion confervicola]
MTLPSSFFPVAFFGTPADSSCRYRRRHRRTGLHCGRRRRWRWLPPPSGANASTAAALTAKPAVRCPTGAVHHRGRLSGCAFRARRSSRTGFPRGGSATAVRPPASGTCGGARAVAWRILLQTARPTLLAAAAVFPVAQFGQGEHGGRCF